MRLMPVWGAAAVGAIATKSGDVDEMISRGPEGKLSHVVIRLGTFSEADVLTRIINDAFRPHRFSFVKDEDGSNRVTRDGEQVRTLMKEPCSAFLVAEESEQDGSKRIVGCCFVSWSGETSSKDPNVDAYMGLLSVPRSCTRRGIGKFLVATAEQHCYKRLKRKTILMELSVLSSRQDLFRWYEAQGYKPGQILPFPRPELVREGCGIVLQLMTKTIS